LLLSAGGQEISIDSGGRRAPINGAAARSRIQQMREVSHLQPP